MDLFVRTNPGFEDITKQEFEREGYSAKILKNGILISENLKEKDIARITYGFKSINNAGILIKIIENFERIYEEVLDFEWKEYVNKDFAVRSENINSSLETLKINEIVGRAIKEKTNSKVDLDYPDILIKPYLTKEKIFITIDLSGFDLWKRGYRIFMHPASIKPTLAFQMILFSEWDPGKSLLDPMCGSGTIPIEACVYARNIPSQYWNKNKLIMRNYDFLGIDWDSFFEKEDKKIRKIKLNIFGFDKNLRYVRGSEINATRALVRDCIKFSRIDLEWLDVKLEEKTIDFIITNPPFGLKMGNPEEAKKVLKLLFYQAEYVLKDNGILTLITLLDSESKEYAKKYGFELLKEREVMHGNLKTKVLVFKKWGP